MLRLWLTRTGCILNILYFEYQVYINYSKNLESRYSRKHQLLRVPGTNLVKIRLQPADGLDHVSIYMRLWFFTGIPHCAITSFADERFKQCSRPLWESWEMGSLQQTRLANQPHTITNICDQCKPKLRKWDYLLTWTWNFHNPIRSQ